MPDEDKTPEKRVKRNNELSESGRILGSKGGRIGGPARARSLTAEQRSAIARLGGLARQAKSKATKKKIVKRKKKGDA